MILLENQNSNETHLLGHKTISFVTNKNSEIVVQSITNDFETEFLDQIYYSARKYTELIDQKIKQDIIFYLIDSGFVILRLAIIRINDSIHDLQNLLIFSEMLEKEELLNLILEIKTKIIDYYN